MVDNSVHSHNHKPNHYHNHDQRKLSNEQLSNHDFFLREQLDMVGKIDRLAATASQKKHYHTHDQHTWSNEQLSNHVVREQLNRVCKIARAR